MINAIWCEFPDFYEHMYWETLLYFKGNDIFVDTKGREVDILDYIYPMELELFKYSSPEAYNNLFFHREYTNSIIVELLTYYISFDFTDVFKELYAVNKHIYYSNKYICLSKIWELQHKLKIPVVDVRELG